VNSLLKNKWTMIEENNQEKKMRNSLQRPLRFSLLVIGALAFGVAGTAYGQDSPPKPGLHAYTKAHSQHDTPPERLGGPLTVELTQQDGVTYFVLPGPRELDPSVFNTPEQPVGFDPAPFPLLGVPLDKRLSADGRYTIADAATPFSDWAESGEGSVTMTLKDVTAIDGANTKDAIDFEADFEAPDGTPYRVVCKKALPHGLAHPFFGGVVTNHLLHGVTGIGSKLMPTEFVYAAFWGVGDVYRGDQKIAEGQMVHGMVTEFVRGGGYELMFDRNVQPVGQTFHLMIPPFKPTPDGLEKAPLMTGFIPFPYVEAHMKQTMENVKELPEAERQKKMAVLEEVKRIMSHTKEHVRKATADGKMDGQPFFHVMFNDFEMTASH